MNSVGNWAEAQDTDKIDKKKGYVAPARLVAICDQRYLESKGYWPEIYPAYTAAACSFLKVTC